MFTAEHLRDAVILAVFAVAGIDLGISFIMRGEREGSRERDV